QTPRWFVAATAEVQLCSRFGLHVDTAPGDESIPHTHDDDPHHPHWHAVWLCARPAPLRPERITVDRGAQELGLEIGHILKDRSPVPAKLFTAGIGPVGVNGLLTAIIWREARYIGIEVARP